MDKYLNGYNGAIVRVRRFDDGGKHHLGAFTGMSSPASKFTHN